MEAASHHYTKQYLGLQAEHGCIDQLISAIESRIESQHSTIFGIVTGSLHLVSITQVP